ncbi:MAG: trigger factor [Phycisphaerales bacterium]|nr:trigger factor [Planctomycetota bacterium]
MTQTQTRPSQPQATGGNDHVQISDAGPCRKRISIRIPKERVSEKLRESLAAISAEAQLPGFRRGHVPAALVEKRFGSALRSEAKNQLVASAYSSAIDKANLKVVGDPFSDTLGAVEIKDGQDLAFDIDVEVMPEFALPSLDGIPVRKPTMSMPDEVVNDEIQKVLINEGQLESREAPEAGDYLTGHGIMTDAEGKEFYNIKGCVVQIPTADRNGKGMILGVMVEDFAKQFGLPKAGESRTIKTKGPENHEVEAIRGADLKITFTVDRVDRIIPAKIEEVVKNNGMTDDLQLREIVRGRLEQRVMIQQQSVMRQQIAQHLLKNTTIDLPQRITSIQSQRNLERRRMELMYRGVDPQKIEEHIAELRSSSSEVAVRELKLFFILNKAADEFQIRVEEAELNGRIAQIAQERGVRPDKLRQELIQRNQVGAIYQQLREHKAMDAILQKAKISEMSAEEFNKAMAEESSV